MKKRRKTPKTNTNISTDLASPSPPGDREHVSIRKIKNGHVVSRSGYKAGKHFDEEVYTPHRPRVEMGSPKARLARERRLAGKAL